MKWNNLTYGRTYSLRSYENETISIVYNADENEEFTADDALAYASTNVAMLHGKLHPTKAGPTGQATVTQKVNGQVTSQQTLPVGPPPAKAPAQTVKQQAQTAQGKTFTPKTPEQMARIMARPYAISLPYPDGAPINVNLAKTYIKSLKYSFAHPDEGGDKQWYGDVYPIDMQAELEPYITKRPASEDPVGDAMGADNIPF